MRLYQHIVVIASEHDAYEGDLEALARDAVHGDALLRTWHKEDLPKSDLTNDEEDFFFPKEVA
jgi:hypothetical protein